MNSTKFKFNGKFYKQKFGTPIGSVISPMLAEIVMEDFEKTVFERLEFVVPFYFRYFDDTLLCVPLDKLQKVIDTFNDYHPRIQFIHGMEKKNRISFLDLEIINPLQHTFFRGTNSYDNCYIRVFGVADYKSELRFWKFKMAAPRWRL